MEKWESILDTIMERKKFSSNQKKHTDFIYGIRAVIESIENGKGVNKVLVQRGLKGDLVKELWSVLKKNNIVHQGVPIQKLDSITRKNHQGVIAFISPIEYYQLDQLLPEIYERGEQPLFVILDRITDVRNLGAIARSAECNRVHALILPSKGAALVTSDAIKTSVGALHKIPVCKVDSLKDTIDYLKNSGITIIGCTEKSDKILYNENLINPMAIIMGSEEDGVSSTYLKMCNSTIKIPLYGNVGSLNVSVAASIFMYEINRQRHA